MLSHVRKYEGSECSLFQSNPLCKFCPGENCPGVVIQVEKEDWKEVACKCGRRMCYRCMEPWHEPIECKMLEEWRKTINDQNHSNRWISSNTKVINSTLYWPVLIIFFEFKGMFYNFDKIEMPKV
jgi:hypothetical protein